MFYRVKRFILRTEAHSFSMPSTQFYFFKKTIIKKLTAKEELSVIGCFLALYFGNASVGFCLKFLKKVKSENIKPEEKRGRKKQNKFSIFFNNFSGVVTKVTGGFFAFIIAIAVVIIWAVTGPIFRFSDTWQLVMNTTSSIITFLMVFVIQHTENKDMIALQLKLDALIEKGNVSDKMIDVEALSDEQLEEIKTFYTTKKEKESKRKIKVIFQ